MHEAEATILSKIIASLRRVRPDFEGLIFTVGDLSLHVGRPNRFKRSDPDSPVSAAPLIYQKASQIRAELVNLEDALLERNATLAQQYAGAALRMLLE